MTAAPIDETGGFRYETTIVNGPLHGCQCAKNQEASGSPEASPPFDGRLFTLTLAVIHQSAEPSYRP